MIDIVGGNIMASKCEGIANGVSLDGIMDGTLGKALRSKYANMYREYMMMCGAGYLTENKIQIFRCDLFNRPNYIVNLPIKRRSTDRADLGMLETNMLRLVEWTRRQDISSVAFPAIGCNPQSGLIFGDDLMPLIRFHLGKPLWVKFQVFVPPVSECFKEIDDDIAGIPLCVCD